MFAPSNSLYAAVCTNVSPLSPDPLSPGVLSPLSPLPGTPPSQAPEPQGAQMQLGIGISVGGVACSALFAGVLAFVKYHQRGRHKQAILRSVLANISPAQIGASAQQTQLATAMLRSIVVPVLSRWDRFFGLSVQVSPAGGQQLLGIWNERYEDRRGSVVRRVLLDSQADLPKSLFAWWGNASKAERRAWVNDLGERIRSMDAQQINALPLDGAHRP